MQISKLRDFKPTYAEKLLSRLDKSVNAIVRVKLKYFKDAFSLEMKCYLQCKKTDFHVLELFLQSFVRASMNIINSLELLGTLILG